MKENSVNEIYQWHLRSAFLRKLETLQPQIFKELKKKVFPQFLEAFLADDPDDLRDALTDPQSYSENVQRFIKNFLEWLESRKINVDWISEELVKLLIDWRENPDHIEKAHLNDFMELSYFPSYGIDFNFEYKFRSLNRDEKLENYRDAARKFFNEQLENYLAEVKKEYSVTPISRNKELQHIEWLINYYFDPKETYGDIATKMQLKSEKNEFSKETIRKAVTELAGKLPFPLKMKKAT